ncbi:MAG: hypothetical protein ABIJ23_02685 [Candidatus Magasanikbacteria bacterium]
MEELYKNKYRIKSTRLANYDYSQPGFYFVTICTKNRRHYFGKITEQKMILNDIGKIIQKYWSEIPQHFENVLTNEFIIMPNHVHGIIEISNNDTPCRDEALPRLPPTTNDVIPRIRHTNTVDETKYNPSDGDEAVPRLCPTAIPRLPQILFKNKI